MVDLNSVNSTSTPSVVDTPIIANSPAAKSQSPQTVPVVADLLSNGVSAALGLKAPTDSANLEVLISQVIEQFEDIRSALKENDLVSNGEKARSVRSLLLSALANHEATLNEIVDLQEQQSQKQATVVSLKEELNQKEIELENLPATVPAETDNTGTPQAETSSTTTTTVDDKTLVKDPEEVARLNAEIAELQSSIAVAEVQLGEITEQIGTKQTEIQGSLAVQEVLRSALITMDSETSSDTVEEDETLSLTSVVRRAVEDIRAGGTERVELLRQLQVDAAEDVDLATAAVEAQVVIDVLNYVEKTVSQSLELAREAIVDQGSIASTGRVKLLLDSGRI